LIPLAILGVLASVLAQQNFNFAAASRLPLVAGWDHLLPKWFTELHPRHRTPSNSILFIGLITLGLGVASFIGAGQQEAFQLLQSAAMTFYAFAYLVMFALPLVGFRGKATPPFWLRGAAVSGFLMTMLSVVLSVFPIIDVPNPAAFTAKVSVVIVACMALGAGLFFSYHRRQGA
jgi:amino acid transporter